LAHTLAELRALSPEALEQEHDRHAKTSIEGLAYIRDEIVRRDTEAQANRIEKMTSQMRWVTGAITVLTIANTAAVIWALRCP
jgi:hypothetical protein